VIHEAAVAKRPIVVVPIVELDIEYRKLADESGAPCYLRVPPVGADEAFIASLADFVRVQHRRGTACETRGVCGAGDGGRICPTPFSGCLSAMTTGADPITWPRAGALGQVPFLMAVSTEQQLLHSPRRRRQRSEHGRCASAMARSK
jgi:hypothetical protein